MAARGPLVFRLAKRIAFWLLTAGQLAWIAVPVASRLLDLDEPLPSLILGFFLTLISGWALTVWARLALWTDPWMNRDERKRLSGWLGLGWFLGVFHARPVQIWQYLRDRVYESRRSPLARARIDLGRGT